VAGFRAPPRAALITALAGYDLCDSAGSSELSRVTPLRVQVGLPVELPDAQVTHAADRVAHPDAMSHMHHFSLVLHYEHDALSCTTPRTPTLKEG